MELPDLEHTSQPQDPEPASASQTLEPEPQFSILTLPHPKSNPCPQGSTVYTGKIKFNPSHGKIAAILLYQEGQVLPESKTSFEYFVLDLGNNVSMRLPNKSETDLLKRGWVPLAQRHKFITMCTSARITSPHLPAAEKCQAWVDDVLADAHTAGYMVLA